MAEVPLVDLEVIVRYSLAIRQELAPAEEVLAALDESRALVLSLLEGRTANGNGDDYDDGDGDGDQQALAPTPAADESPARTAVTSAARASSRRPSARANAAPAPPCRRCAPAWCRGRFFPRARPARRFD